MSYIRADGGIVGASSVGGYVRMGAARAGQQEAVQDVSGPSWTVEMQSVEVVQEGPKTIILRANQTFPWRPLRTQPRRISRARRRQIKLRTNNKTTTKGK